MVVKTILFFGGRGGGGVIRMVESGEMMTFEETGRRQNRRAVESGQRPTSVTRDWPRDLSPNHRPPLVQVHARRGEWLLAEMRVIYIILKKLRGWNDQARLQGAEITWLTPQGAELVQKKRAPSLGTFTKVLHVSQHRSRPSLKCIFLSSLSFKETKCFFPAHS